MKEFIKKWVIDESTIGLLINEMDIKFNEASRSGKIGYYIASGVIRNILDLLFWLFGFLVVSLIIGALTWLISSDAELLTAKTKFFEDLGMELTFLLYVVFKTLSLLVFVLIFAIPFRIIRTITSLIYYRKSFK